MNNKTILLILLISPAIVLGLSTLAFTFGYGPVATKNYGTFFEKSFPVHSMENLEDNPGANFSGRTWVPGNQLVMFRIVQIFDRFTRINLR